MLQNSGAPQIISYHDDFIIIVISEIKIFIQTKNATSHPIVQRLKSLELFEIIMNITTNMVENLDEVIK